MQNIQLFFKKNPDKETAFIKTAKAFSKKHSSKYKKLNSKHLKNNENLEFPQKWKEMKAAFKALKLENDIFTRCYICGKEMNDVYVKDIEHYRPKGSTKAKKAKMYWWLAYDYENYYLSCAECNRGHKNDFFPLDKAEDRATKPTDSIEKEEPLLLNPMKDNPHDYFRLVFILHPRSRDKKIAILLPKSNLDKNSIQYRKAKMTIETFNLDLRYLEFLQNKSIKTHKELLDRKAVTDSRLDNCLNFHTDLRELAKKRQNLSAQDFIIYWRELKKGDKPITSLGLAELIFKGKDNFTDLS